MHEIQDSVLSLNEIQQQARQDVQSALKAQEYPVKEVSECPFCASKKHQQLLERDRYGFSMAARLCHNCGLVYSTPILDTGALSGFYERDYHRLNYGRLDIGGHLFSARQGALVIDFLKEQLSEKKDLRVGEIGCGAADILNAIKNAASDLNSSINVIGTEFSLKCIEVAKERYGIEVLEGSFEAFIEKDLKVDLLVLSHVFEHMIDLPLELEKVKKVLKPGGLVYIEVPGLLEILKQQPGYQFQFQYLHNIAHNYNFTLVTLRNVLQNSGFTLIKGNESVRGLFRLDESFQVPAHKNFINDSERILHYLSSELPHFIASSPVQKKFTASKMREFTENERASALLEWEQMKLSTETEDLKAILKSKNKYLKGLQRVCHFLEKDKEDETPSLTSDQLQQRRGELTQFYEKHKGQRCFLLMGGSSLKQTDLSLLEKEVTFTMNQVIFFCQQSEFSPTYYISENQKFIGDNYKKIRGAGSAIQFFPERCADQVGLTSQTFFLPLDGGYYSEKGEHYQKARFSEQISETVYSGASVATLIYQLIAYMGFKEVYLLGVDAKISESEARDFHLIQEEYKTRGISIYNATQGGKFESCERADFYSLFPQREVDLNLPNGKNQSFLAKNLTRLHDNGAIQGTSALYAGSLDSDILTLLKYHQREGKGFEKIYCVGEECQKKKSELGEKNSVLIDWSHKSLSDEFVSEYPISIAIFERRKNKKEAMRAMENMEPLLSQKSFVQLSLVDDPTDQESIYHLFYALSYAFLKEKKFIYMNGVTTFFEEITPPTAEIFFDQTSDNKAFLSIDLAYFLVRIGRRSTNTCVYNIAHFGETLCYRELSEGEFEQGVEGSILKVAVREKLPLFFDGSNLSIYVRPGFFTDFYKEEQNERNL